LVSGAPKNFRHKPLRYLFRVLLGLYPQKHGAGSIIIFKPLKMSFMETTMLGNICEISISYEPKIKRSLLPTLKTSQESYQLLMESWNMKTINLMEEFKIIYMNRASRVLGIHHLSSGSIVGTVVDIRLIFATALKCLATKIIICHNHPSGNLSPSKADISITQNIAHAGKILQIELLDHLIISEEGYFSFCDQGYI